MIILLIKYTHIFVIKIIFVIKFMVRICNAPEYLPIHNMK